MNSMAISISTTSAGFFIRPVPSTASKSMNPSASLMITIMGLSCTRICFIVTVRTFLSAFSIHGSNRLEITKGFNYCLIYISICAMVRAKVKSQQSIDHWHQNSSKKSLHKPGSSTNLQQTRKGKKATLNIAYGLSGSGKSTVAGWVAEQTVSLHIRFDALRKDHYRIPLDVTDPESIYTTESTRGIYEKLGTITFLLLNKGINVVLDATYSYLLVRESILVKDGGIFRNIIRGRCSTINPLRLARISKKLTEL